MALAYQRCATRGASYLSQADAATLRKQRHGAAFTAGAKVVTPEWVQICSQTHQLVSTAGYLLVKESGTRESNSDSADGAGGSEDGSQSEDCSICWERLEEPFQLRCGHKYCHDCLAQHFQDAERWRRLKTAAICPDRRSQAPQSARLRPGRYACASSHMPLHSPGWLWSLRGVWLWQVQVQAPAERGEGCVWEHLREDAG